ncbi:zinc finger-containing ubiquitin peptidase 1 isoform X2 [Boleophthalmus pectinirostris]|uniref:zinc finger-containing ubiquitin peptidase 1 isoform X2 n=1 Tax=Boleophthalmus pectinirostris TaxID=150288 RepID=UPI00242CD639|nr:zinc finger-containing ubiquitin peptidase 1 isoform X2 [Boleophthalmus pectinirostris]
MLTCDICGEELLLEEDLKTHLLLSHLENNMHCPLCSLSGVSYDELSLHINSAHPDNQNKTPTRTKRDEASPESSSSPDLTQYLPSPELFASSDCSGADSDISSTSSPSLVKSKACERRFVCPMCACVCTDSFSLQEHVELHLDPAYTAQGFQCPMCSVACSDSFSLQEHVELHLEPGASVNASPGSDLKLARRLQEEEEQMRREEEARTEKEEFKKLQKQFGLDGSGGYRKQMEQRLERAVARGLMDPAEFHSKRAEMMEALATGQDDGQTRTQGVLKVLSEHYQSEARDCAHVWLCADTDHFCSSEGDRGWGCGYRNFQMLLSSLLRLEEYAAVLPDMTVPSIPRVQGLIQEAWGEGLDPRGASHFNNRLQGTRAWIGATEIYSLLTSLHVRARIVDFHQPTGPGDTHPRLFEWVKQYFSRGQNSGRLPPRIIHTKLPPLYLQHQGHSRTVVGLEQKRSGALCLLILDPGCSSSDLRRIFRPDSVNAALRQMRRFPSGLKHKQYQLVAAEGVLSEQDKQVCVLNSKTLHAERIP